MEYYLENMEDSLENMNEIVLSNLSLPGLCAAGSLAAAEDFFHSDRTPVFNVLIYVTDGAIYVTEESENGESADYEANAGEILFLKSGLRHYGKKAIKKGSSWMYAHFTLDSPDFKKENFSEFSPDSSPVGIHENNNFFIRIPKKSAVPYDSGIPRIFSELIDLCKGGDTLKRWTANIRLFELLTETAFSLCENACENTLADKISQYLSDNSGKPFSSQALERRFFLSYKRLAVIFKEKKGVTMQQYHTEVRMEKARRLLRTTLMPINEIALAAGYGDPLYFSKTFRQHTGMSPKAYRKLPPVY